MHKTPLTSQSNCVYTRAHARTRARTHTHTHTHMVKLQMCCSNIALHACRRHPLHIASLPDQFLDFPHVLSVPLTDSENRMTFFLISCILFESIKFMIYAALILCVLRRRGTWLCIVRDEHGECLVTVCEKMMIRCVAL